MRIPKHLAVIPDGNRRWAKSHGMEKQNGYEHGLHPGIEILRLAQKYGIEEVTFYGFTTDNCKRPKVQVQSFIDACKKAVQLMTQEDIKLLIVGNTASCLFPEELLPLAKKRQTFGKGTIKVNLLLNYGWEWDMGHMNTRTSNRNLILSSLRSKEISRIDLIMRWGGHTRLSGLLPLQSVYADFYGIPQMWPDFTPEQFINGLKWYSKLDITLGG